MFGWCVPVLSPLGGVSSCLCVSLLSSGWCFMLSVCLCTVSSLGGVASSLHCRCCLLWFVFHLVLCLCAPLVIFWVVFVRAGPGGAPRGSKEPLQHPHRGGGQGRDAGRQRGPGEDEGLLPRECKFTPPRSPGSLHVPLRLGTQHREIKRIFILRSLALWPFDLPVKCNQRSV